jgi:16S rRNA (cytidine1402-2'-O)-methyltransferase
MPGTLFVIATPIGNLEDISARALRILAQVAIIAAEDTRRTAHLLARYDIRTSTTSLHEHNEGQKSPALLARLERGDDVAVVSDAGTPTVSDPGRRLIAAAAAAGIRVETVPGPSAVMAALAVSGFPADSFTFLGFPPVRSQDRRSWFDRLLAAGGTVVFFEAPHRIRSTLAELERTVAGCQVLVCRELTKSHEHLVRGPIDEVLRTALTERGEFTVVVYIGETTNKVTLALPEPAELVAEVGLLTKSQGVSRRRAISTVAKRFGLAPNELYKLLEEAKK